MARRHAFSDTFVDVWLGSDEDPGQGPIYTDFTGFHHALESYRSLVLASLFGPLLGFLLIVTALILMGVPGSAIILVVLVSLPVAGSFPFLVKPWLWMRKRPRYAGWSEVAKALPRG